MEDSGDEDELPFFGTALPPLEDEKNAPRKQELDLTVRDSKGRRRFHGAFTGGFSAGYFNTVGSVEGWVPSQYLSNRDGKWDKSLLRRKPEDFMDEEDFSAFGIAPKTVRTKDKFKSTEVLSFAGFRDPNASITDILKEIIRPKTESIGMKLFKLMRKGTSFKKAQVVEDTLAKVKSYGCQLPPGFKRSDDEEDDEEDDYNVELKIPYEPKDNTHGLGYKALKVLSSSTETSGGVKAVLSDGKKLNIKGEAFGYGALEAEDDYDEDAQVYGNDDMSNYDFSIGSKPSTSRNALKHKNIVFDSIEFVKATKQMSKIFTSNYKLPSIPRGWRPKPPFCTTRKRKSRWDEGIKESGNEKSQPDSKTTQENKRPVTMNANARAILLGEEVIRVIGNKTKEVVNTEKVDERTEKDILPLERSKPASGFLAHKFVRSENVENVSDTKLTPGLVQSRDVPRDETSNIQQQAENTKIELGVSKRTTYQWHPHTLLSKRFNVPHPYPQFPDVVGTVRVAHRVSSTTRN
ncbi:hypothetical protein B4U79_13192 [Dinothrombium tinctorium]|uniref:G patch domain-containing protein n=1 Tax=Dinothrombium tinctorium TaxID=1965070 RepID=A0A443RP55_9ACAR|nr:hypothetical protein B4U79_13192 [Dinothrombium tinctorium]